jgi:hypothetical protein
MIWHQKLVSVCWSQVIGGRKNDGEVSLGCPESRKIIGYNYHKEIITSPHQIRWKGDFILLAIQPKH